MKSHIVTTIGLDAANRSRPTRQLMTRKGELMRRNSWPHGDRLAVGPSRTK